MHKQWRTHITVFMTHMTLSLGQKSETTYSTNEPEEKYTYFEKKRIGKQVWLGFWFGGLTLEIPPFAPGNCKLMALLNCPSYRSHRRLRASHRARLRINA